MLAAAGLASRRASEIMISEGRVEVNGRVVTEQGLRIDPERDVVRVDGSRIPPPRRHLYLVLNKPRGVVSTLDDPEGRRTINDLLANLRHGKQSRLFHVGRLDTDTEGLLILTNDGEFAHRLAHPSYEVPKTYLAEVAGVVTPATVKRLREGLTLDDGPVRPSAVKVVSSAGEKSLVKITLLEGPQPHRAPYHGGGRPPGPAIVPDGNRAGAAREPQGRGVPRPDPRRARRPARPDQRLT